MTVALALCIALLVGAGVWLLLDRDLLRVVLGLGLLGHGVVLLLVASGRPGEPPLLDRVTDRLADPLPQALGLTAIVIGFAVTAYLLAIAQADQEGTPVADAGDLGSEGGR